jgi:alkylation response protein AidB-like acyl-CoA dehydrogenase
VDFRASPAQLLLVSTAREFLRKRAEDPGLWRHMAELGWPGLLVPPEYGGSGGSIVDVVLLVEELGRAGATGPFVTSAVVATSLLLASGHGTDQRKRLLASMATGERIVAVAVLDDGASFALDRITLAVEAPGRLTGRKLFVEAADVADTLVVAARATEGDIALLLVPADRPGIARFALDTMVPDSVFEVTFDRVSVGPEDHLVPPGAGHAVLAAALQAGALARTAEMVGAAQRALELAVEHAKTRVQGGRPIGAYQAIQHACADLVRDVDASRGLLHAAAWRMSEGLPAAADVAMAKAYAGEACLAVARRAHQIFGAIGYCDEHPLHRLHKRIHAASLDCGDGPLHLETVAQAIGLR